VAHIIAPSRFSAVLVQNEYRSLDKAVEVALFE